jgi:hypothetical protein
MSSEPESKADAEALVPQFQLEKVLNQGKLSSTLLKARFHVDGALHPAMSVI